jgi:hypothetical protein
MIFKKSILGFIYLISITNSTLIYAQKMFEMTGVILRQDSLTPIDGAVIYNRNSFLGTLSNKNGNFKMRCKFGDTLQVTHIGFINYLLIINDTSLRPNEKIRITMQVRSYELQGVDVRAYRLRQRKSLKEFSLKRTDNITIDIGDINFESVPYYGFQQNQSPYMGIMPSYGLTIPDFREIKRQKQLAKVAEMEKKDLLKQYINYKYSKKMVNDFTGLTGNQLENFMNFCRPSDKQILEANAYDLAYYVLQCYDKFREEYE